MHSAKLVQAVVLSHVAPGITVLSTNSKKFTQKFN
jgi:hypothetical protein